MKALVLIVLSTCLVLGGCGQKGPLTPPPPPESRAN